MVLFAFRADANSLFQIYPKISQGVNASGNAQLSTSFHDGPILL